jgi:hypothetical protein
VARNLDFLAPGCGFSPILEAEPSRAPLAGRGSGKPAPAKEAQMAGESLELKISFKRLLIGLLLTVVPISLAGLYAITRSDQELQRTVGTHFKIFAEFAAWEVAQFVHDRVVDTGKLAAAGAVVEAVTAANRAWQGMSEQAIAARIQKIEEQWPTPAAEPLVRDILSSRASLELKRFRDLDPRFLRITVTDARGATVAATHKTLDYFQADEEYWQAIYAQGRGAVSLTDILYDPVTRSNYIGIGVPVVEPGTSRFIGTLDALVDVSSLFRLVNQAHPPLNLRTVLVKEDGTVIASPEATLSANLKSAEFAAVRDAMATLEGRQTGYVVTDVPEMGRRLIGFADTGLKADYKNLGWAVLVSQDAREAFASIRMVGRLTAFLAAVGLLLVTLLVVYFSLHRRVVYEPLLEAVESKKAGAEKPAES